MEAQTIVDAVIALDAETALAVLASIIQSKPELAPPLANLIIPDLTYPPSKAIERRSKGVIKSMVAEKGYGFIECTELNEVFGADVFLHHEQSRGYLPGQVINFAVMLNKDNRPQAYDLVAEGDADGVGFTRHRTTKAYVKDVCPMAHPLKQQYAPVDSGCDVCQRAVSPGEIFYSCRQCNYDKCADCVVKVTPQMKAGDWICPNCNDLVFSKNPKCRSCGNPKPDGIGDVSQGMWSASKQMALEAAATGGDDGSSVSKMMSMMQQGFMGGWGGGGKGKGKGNKSFGRPDEKEPLGQFDGTIKSFNPVSGYGFIECEELRSIGCANDVFLHHMQLNGFNVGDRVSFNGYMNSKGQPQAKDLGPPIGGPGGADFNPMASLMNRSSPY